MSSEAEGIAEPAPRRRRRRRRSKPGSFPSLGFAREAPWITAAFIVVAPQVMAGAFGWSVTVIAIVSLVALTFALIQTDLRRDTVPLVLWAGVGATIWTTLQLLPLGTALISRLSADRDAPLRLLTAALDGKIPASATAITFDPAATKLEIIKGCSLLCTFIACYLLARRGQSRLLLGAVAASGTAMALVALGHAALDAHSLFGIYEWRFAAPRLPAPILNANCLAGFMVLTTPVALALAVTTPDARMRLAYSLEAFTIAATGLLTGSRGGTAAMVFALFCSLLMGRIRPLIRRDRWQHASVAGAVVAGALAIAVVVGAEPLLASLNSGGFSKFEEISRAFGLALDHPWVGVGRGGFSAAMSPTMSWVGRFVHAENFIATWSSEWGIPVAGTLLAVISVTLGRLSIDRSVLLNGAAIALVAFAAQNLLDLGLELLGIATVAAATLGAAMGDADGEIPADAPSVRLNLGRVAGAVAMTTTLVLALFSAGAWVDGDDAFQKRLEVHRDARDPVKFRNELVRAITAHPFEPVFFMLAGGEAADRRDRAGLRWLNLAMLRAPEWSAPHAEAARLLLALGHPRQAALEAGHAGKRHPMVGASASCAIATENPDPELILIAASVIPAGERKQVYFSQIFPCLGSDLARQVDALLLRKEGNNALGHAPVLREHARLVAEGKTALALQLLQEATRVAKPEEHLVLQYVRALLAANDLDGATAQLQRARTLGAATDAVARIDAEIATLRGDAAGMRAAIEVLRTEGASSGERLADAATLLATLEERLGNPKAAAAALDDAAMLHANPNTLRSVLSFALRTGNMAKALQARTSLCGLSPSEPECMKPSQ